MEISETRTVQIVLNGEARDVPEGLTIDRLLEFLQIDPGRVAIELDGVIVRRQSWPESEVRDGAQLEVVWFVGGG